LKIKKRMVISNVEIFMQIEKKIKEHLRVIVCGSVDDGKSTLIGRLLYDANKIHKDQLKTLQEESKKTNKQNKLDFSLLVDGLHAEREQGITIDVAYRYFSTNKNKIIIADSPGHEQYTRNMATGASTASVGIILVDSQKGILKQTKRHCFILSILGVKNLLLIVNKMDLINYEEKTYNEIKNVFNKFTDSLNFKNTTSIPISALNGDNVFKKSMQTRWYKGPTLINYLDNNFEETQTFKTLRLPIQYVIRNQKNLRSYAGTIASGKLSIKQKVKVLPSGFETRINKIFESDKEINQAYKMQAITFTLDDHIDLSRGDFIVDTDNPCDLSDQFRVDLIWMDVNHFLPGRTYDIKMECRTLKAKIFIKYKYDIENFKKNMSKILKLNDIASCDIIFETKIVYENYEVNKTLGSFIVIDPDSNATCGAGRINFALRRSSNLVFQNLDIDKNKRSLLKNHPPCIVWLTGISGSGKSTIANILEKKLYNLKIHTMLLDGDNVRLGLNKDLGFSDEDRVENIRRIAEVSKLMLHSGLVTIVSFISPFKLERKMARDLVNKNEFIEVFIDTPLEIAEKRDPKGLYKKARLGEIPNFTEINSPYEKPENPELILKTTEYKPEQSADLIINYLRSKKILF